MIEKDHLRYLVSYKPQQVKGEWPERGNYAWMVKAGIMTSMTMIGALALVPALARIEDAPRSTLSGVRHL